MNLQENIFRIKQIMGVINEQTYMESYSPANILDFCGYRAIEMFEETKGNPLGKTMGATYFENNLETYEKMISDKISKTIGMSTFNKFPPKLKMQIWSWMFNNTDASLGTVKWIAGLSQAINFDKFMNLETKKYDDKKALDYRLKVSNQNSNEYKNAILEIQAFKGDWDVVYTNYLKVLDMQYKSTASSNDKQGSYDNSWKYRPGDLDNFYNACKSSTSQPQPATTQTATGTQIQTNTSILTVQEKLKNGQQLTPEELNVKGDLALGFSKVKSLPNGLKVGGNLFLNNCDNLTSLPNGLEVGGSLFLMDVKINSLPKRLVVGGSLDLTGSAITSLPNGLKVGGLLKVDNTKLIKYPDEKLFKMIGSNGYIKLGIFRKDSNYTTNLEAPSNNQELPWEKQTSSDTTATQVAQTTGGETSTTPQPATTGGATSTNPQPPPATTGGETPTTSTPTQTTAKPYPSIDNPFTPRNGDPWKYAYDGTNLIVKSPTTGNEYNLKDPNYFTTYPYSKLKNEEQLNNAIASIKNAYGEKLGM